MQGRVGGGVGEVRVGGRGRVDGLRCHGDAPQHQQYVRERADHALVECRQRVHATLARAAIHKGLDEGVVIRAANVVHVHQPSANHAVHSCELQHRLGDAGKGRERRDERHRHHLHDKCRWVREGDG